MRRSRASSGIVENNRLIGNRDDGIEIRLHSYVGPLEIVIRNNHIEGSREDGIQLIDYSGLSSRHFRIEGNLIIGSAMAGIGLMADGNTKENFSGASIPEPIEVVNNTFVNNPYGITGGDNMTVRNNIFASCSTLALKNVDASSSVASNLFWNNASNHQASNVDQTSSIFADPLFDLAYRLQQGSPAIDAGVDVGRAYNGAAPDLGAYETV